MSSLGKVFKYFWGFIKPYRVGYFSVFFVLMIRITSGTLVSGYVYKIIIDSLNNNTLSVGDRYDITLLLLVPLGASFLLALLMGRYAEWVMFRFTAKATKNIYDSSFKKLIDHSFGFYNNNFTGSLVAKTKRFVGAFEQTTGIAVFNFWPTIVLITGSVVALSFESKKLGLYFLIWCLLYGIIIVFFVKKKIKIDLERAEADSKITGVLSDAITNMPNIKSFAASGKEFNYFQEVTSFLKSCMYRAYTFTMGRHAFQAFTMLAFEVFVIYSSIGFWRKGEITIGVFVMVYAYLHTITARIWDLSSGLTNFMENITNAKEMVDIFEKEIEVKDPVYPEISKIKDGVIEFKNVSFSYKEGADVLQNFNLKIQKGEKIGLVGYSGSGKSTITKLLLRFVDIDDGEILIDGQNINTITQDDLRLSIAYVPQESILFHRSIKDNIGYGKESSTDEDIIKAAKLANADMFITKTSKGYDTLVGERGVKLSGGERQRIAIARAMLKPAPILILDEATSSLDGISERYIQDSFNELMKDKTSIVIAHRLSTIQKMDRIIVLDQGRIVEEGTHKELLEKNGAYSKLWDHQTGGFLEE